MNYRFALPVFLPLLACGVSAMRVPGGPQMQSAKRPAPEASAAGSNDAASAGDVALPPADTSAAAQRAIVEADIIQLQQGRLFAISKSGSLSVVDVSAAGKLALLGQTQLQGEPFEMYLRASNQVVAMQNGEKKSIVTLIDATDPAAMKATASLEVAGELADSRIVGDVLYLATYENGSCDGCGPKPRTLVTTYNLLTQKQIDQEEFASNAPDAYNLPWGQNWKRSIYVTDKRLYIGGHADVDPKGYWDPRDTTQTPEPEGIIDVLDITDPAGDLKSIVRIRVAGAILSRWQLDEKDGILRVVSQQGAGRTGNGLNDPRVVTLKIDAAQDGTTTFTPLGAMSLQMPKQEGLRSVRFDGNRAYAITYNQTDPLFIIDLSDPAAPKQRGELFMPGFVYHMEPFGDRVLGIGIDRDDQEGSLNVSLFDVSNPDAPTMKKRVSFASPHVYEDYQILEQVMAEDQDRIQKAFRVLDGGLIVAPFSGLDGCSGGGVQLIDWKDDTLTKRALLDVPGNPRRAFKNGDEIIAVSDSNVRSFGLQAATQTADLTIGTCTARQIYYYGGGEWEGGFEGNWEGPYGNDAIDSDYYIGLDPQGGGYYPSVPVHYGCGQTSNPGSIALALFVLVLLRRRHHGRD